MKKKSYIRREPPRRRTRERLSRQGGLTPVEISTLTSPLGLGSPTESKKQ